MNLYTTRDRGLAEMMAESRRLHPATPEATYTVEPTGGHWCGEALWGVVERRAKNPPRFVSLGSIH